MDISCHGDVVHGAFWNETWRVSRTGAGAGAGLRVAWRLGGRSEGAGCELAGFVQLSVRGVRVLSVETVL